MIRRPNFIHDLGLVTLPENLKEVPDFLNFMSLNNRKRDAAETHQDPSGLLSYILMENRKAETTETTQFQADGAEGEDDDDDEDATEEIGGNSNPPHKAALLSLQHSSSDYEMYSLTQKLQYCESQVGDLERERAALNSELKYARKRQKTSKTQIEEHKDTVRAERDAAGISEELWQLYEDFCEALQPEEFTGERSFTLKKTYSGSYIKYDPTFMEFKSTVGDAYNAGNWRCECFVDYSDGGAPTGYRVKYYALPQLKGQTWENQWSKLYRLAISAAQQGSAAALDMLVALPEKDASSGEGWLFEFGFNESRRSLPILSQRWDFRASHNLLSPITTDAKRARLVATYNLSLKIENKS
ncbi:hypothetical protein E0Z10_g8290 [Xylaria hypoxylon]|uniref:Uncharacterized protein n=1 Tax=Xylaria hypoxylon TaxID=37992 RepID=A0A4Z0YVN1_9PEZI|nr:hypothetical protein E0Z10_g8290 [Xylaria hypoxylon]